MDQTRLGTTGLQVSRICLGMMSFGEPARGGHPWSLGEDDARPIVRAALDAGITFYDTANVYSAGSSEEITGKLLLEAVDRDDVVIATKVHGRMRPGPNGAGLSRAAILAEADASLRRLGTDFIDLYQIHRWDPATPIEETLEALDSLVRSGKVRYLGASSMWAWQFSKALHTAGEHGWHRFVTMQDHYNLLAREEEREMHPLCLDAGVGVIPWSPLARGRLTRDPDVTTSRSQDDAFAQKLYTDGSDAEIVTRVAEVAQQRGVSRAQVALAWVLSKPVVTAPIVGVTSATHLADAVAAVDVGLTEEEVTRLEEPYRPHEVSGFS